MKVGRPKKDRNRVAGKNLRFALKVLGKSWRKNTQDPDHIANWDRWNLYNLPKSTVTIDTDIKEGVPLDRILPYAKCFKLSDIDFSTREIDMYDALGLSVNKQHTIDPFPWFWQYPSVRENYLLYNSKDQLERLFERLAGVYRVYYVMAGCNSIFCALFHIYEKKGAVIYGRGLFIEEGKERHVISSIFRWQKNIHGTIFCLEDMELGYCLMRNPLQTSARAKGGKLFLEAHGVTDSIQSDHTIITYEIRLQKIALPTQQPFEAFWEAECRALHQRPYIRRRDPEYDQLLSAFQPHAL